MYWPGVKQVKHAVHPVWSCARAPPRAAQHRAPPRPPTIAFNYFHKLRRQCVQRSSATAPRRTCARHYASYKQRRPVSTSQPHRCETSPLPSPPPPPLQSPCENGLCVAQCFCYLNRCSRHGFFPLPSGVRTPITRWNRPAKFPRDRIKTIMNRVRRWTSRDRVRRVRAARVYGLCVLSRPRSRCARAVHRTRYVAAAAAKAAAADDDGPKAPTVMPPSTDSWRHGVSERVSLCSWFLDAPQWRADRYSGVTPEVVQYGHGNKNATRQQSVPIPTNFVWDVTLSL